MSFTYFHSSSLDGISPPIASSPPGTTCFPVNQLDNLLSRSIHSQSVEIILCGCCCAGTGSFPCHFNDAVRRSSPSAPSTTVTDGLEILMGDLS